MTCLFKRTRYFHVVYQYKTINVKGWIVSTASLSVKVGTIFNQEKFIKDIKEANSLNGFVLVLTWQEFKNKKDHDAFYKTESDG